MRITLYTTDCPNCKVLERKLDLAGIGYRKNYDPDQMLAAGMLSAPGLQLDNEVPMDFGTAIRWVNSQTKG